MPEVKQLRCVSWVAVSSKAQYELESPEDQRRENLRLINDLGQRHAGYEGVLVAELEVPGESRYLASFAEAVEHLEAYTRLDAIMRTRSADLLVFRDMDRLGRTAALQMTVSSMCHRAGIALYNRTAPPRTLLAHEQSMDDADLLLTVNKAAYGEMEIRNLVRRRQMGMIGRTNRGLFPSRPPLGYRYVYDQSGQRSPVVDEHERDIVLEIFAAYLRGETARAIAITLNNRGVPTRSNARWGMKNVMRVIDRAFVYAGFVEFNRASHRDTVRARGLHDAIISLAYAKEIAAERASRQNAPKAVGRPALFSRAVYCAECGSLLSAHSSYLRQDGFRQVFYRCATHSRAYLPEYDDVQPCSVSTNEEALRDVLGEAVRFLSNGHNLRKIVEQVPHASAVLSARIESLELDLARLQERRNRIVYMASNDIITMDEARVMLEPLNAQRDRLNVEIGNLSSNMPDDAETVAERAERLRNAVRQFPALLDTMTTAEANAWIRRHFRFVVDINKHITVEFR